MYSLKPWPAAATAIQPTISHRASGRLARDLGRELGKNVDLEIVGEETEVDRDLLDRLDGPLSHLIRQCSRSRHRRSRSDAPPGKTLSGRLAIRARHQAGWLVVGLSDDGAGLDEEAIRSAIVRRACFRRTLPLSCRTPSYYDFLLLPGFSLRESHGNLRPRRRSRCGSRAHGLRRGRFSPAE